MSRSQSCPISVLLVEGDRSAAALIKRMLEGTQRTFICEHATRLSSALVRLVDGGIDVLMVDVELPDSTGPETVMLASLQAVRVPVIVLLSAEQIPWIARIRTNGGSGYVIKERLTPGHLRQAVLEQVEKSVRAIA